MAWDDVCVVCCVWFVQAESMKNASATRLSQVSYGQAPLFSSTSVAFTGANTVAMSALEKVVEAGAGKGPQPVGRTSACREFPFV